ncbi:hypothetical protein EC844_12614 [Acinetobacter calcoaceticus]|uniref:Phage-related minor tail protein n=1 Tax=Acinetobacter calcoaceticus TaxID=471 RepID=A0A4R1XII4_ACICA|nr:hypothetical protein EC844_12614 [Acinetobacter calcoaceticus]
MSRNTTVSLTLQIRGNAGRELTRISEQQVRSTTKINQQWTQIGNAQARFTNTARAGASATRDTSRASDQLLRTNRLLEGVLRQQAIQTRIQSQSLRNQTRDYQTQLNSLRQQVAEANRLRQQLEQAGRANRGAGGGGGGMQTTAGIVGGTYAGGSIVSNYLDDPRQYMKQISLATDTSLAGKKLSVKAFNNKSNEMEGFVRQSAIQGGSTPQQLVQALNTLVASNVYEFDELKNVLMQVSRTAFAGGANPDDIALMTIAQRNFGLTNLGQANDQAMKAGQLGSFELRDMARYMPDLLTQGRNAGYIGDKGYRDLLSMMQLSKKTAGTAEGAAVNMSDLLGSFSQYHLGLSFAKHIKVQKGDPIAAYGVSKKRKGFDWPTYATNMREQGVGEVEAAAILMNRQMENSPLYRKYRDKAQVALKSNNNAEYLENVQAATQIAAQAEVGKIFHNKQALMAFMGVTMNMESGGFKDQLDQGIKDSNGAIDMSHTWQAAQEYAKDNSFDTSRFNAKVDVYNGNAGWLGDLKQGLADFASSNAGVAAAASAAVVGLTAVAAAGGIAALAMRGGGGAATAGAAGASQFSRVMPWLKKAAIPITVAAGAYGIYDTATDDSLSQYQKNVKQAGIVGGTGGAIAGGIAGAKLGALGGAAIGSIVPVVGTAAGAAVGGALGGIAGGIGGWWAGDKGGEAFGEYFNEQHGIMEEQNQLIEQQSQYTQQLLGKMDNLISATNNIKPTVNFGGGSLLDMMSNNAATQEKRHGAPTIPFMLQPR